MPNLKLAFVNFFKEKRGRKIVSVSDFEDFSPTHHSDFDGDRTYRVKWAHLPTEGSSSSEGLYEAKLLCLGGDIDDLLLEARTQGLKISQAMIDEFAVKKKTPKKVKTPAKSSRGRMLKPSAAAAKPLCEGSSDQDPRPSKKKKKSLEDSSKERRKLKALENYDSLFSSETVSKDKDATLRDKDATSKDKEAVSKDQGLALKGTESAPQETDTASNKDMEPGSAEAIVKSAFRLLNQTEYGKPAVFDKLQGEDDNTCDQVFKPLVMDKTLVLPCSGNSEDSKTSIAKVSPILFYGNANKKKSHNSMSKKKQSDSSSSDTTLSSEYDSDKETDKETDQGTDQVKELYYKKILKLEDELKSAKAKLILLKDEALLKDKTIQDQQNKITQLQEDCQRYSKVNLDLSEKLVSGLSSIASSKKGKTHVSKTLNFEDNSAQKSRTVRNILSDSDLDDSGLLPISPSPSKKMKRDQVSPLSSSKKLTPKHSTKTTKVNDVEDCIVSNEELSTMIVDALQGKTPLQADGNGKVHLGNGVWISEKAWLDKIKKASVSPSIGLRDAMSKLYKPEELAERSLEGGTPVKSNSSGNKIKKKQMTPAKREALLGLFRAKTAVASGSTDKCFWI